ncbi:hypothetical protein CAPTEDRAFT_121302 [Capitella teleta]|uniref:BTB domain-containing protein n=1 Tax=Capitella teleta TaxID=283909 RepID=R7VEM6_CAPTE|nr:hypothetical protein CAPTEDRAFT_121302 [Capitella teleta]|eukprot:ELU14125.1 hypothetical protein CAPTEDRAFT_121302 [Capitella teleta]
MSATFRNMRHSDEMVDVVLVFEKTRVKCHRLVLAASCEYFRRMFQTDMQERDAGEIPMKDVSSSTGLLLVEYLYSGNIEISVENAQELMAVSDRLLLTKLKKNVEEFLCEQVAADNCLSFNNLARLYSLKSLLEVCQNYLSDHWRKLLESDEIDQLTEADLFMVFGGKMDVESFLDSVECLNLKSLKWSQFPPLPLALSETKPVYVQNKLFIVGGWLSQKTYSRDVYEFDSAKRAWRSRSAMPEECRAGGVVSFDDKLFVVGGDPKSCMHYDPRTDLWVQLQKPLFEHFYGPAAVWNDQIVVCGGAGTDSIEEYDPQSVKWSTWDLKMPSMNDYCFALII